MILQLNHLRRDHAAASAQDVIGALYALLEEGCIEQSQFAHLRVHLDWIQYRQNFREPVTVTLEAGGHPEAHARLSIANPHVDTRQIAPGSLRDEILRAIVRASAEAATGEDRLFLEEFKSFRFSIAWEFNRLYWHRLADWERATGRAMM